MKPRPHVDEFYILARTPRTGHYTRVLKQGETFAVFDLFGDLTSRGLGEFGLYHEDTRYLSRLELRMDRNAPLLFLSSTIQKTNEMMTVDLMNPDILTQDDDFVPRGVLHISRSTFLWNGACYERLRITNFGMEPATIPLSFLFDADFADIFEVRGTPRKRKGRRLEDNIEDSRITLSYEGLDGRIRKTRLQFLPTPEEIVSSRAGFELALQPKDESVIFLTVCCDSKTDQKVSMQRRFLWCWPDPIKNGPGICSSSSQSGPILKPPSGGSRNTGMWIKTDSSNMLDIPKRVSSTRAGRILMTRFAFPVC